MHVVRFVANMQTYGFDMTHRLDPDLHVVLEGSFCTRAISSRRMVYDIQCYELYFIVIIIVLLQSWYSLFPLLLWLFVFPVVVEFVQPLIFLQHFDFLIA